MNQATVIHGDCIEEMAKLPDASIDLCLTDPPYGTTQCKWDAVVPFDAMWRELKRICKPTAAFVFTAGQPFTSLLIASRLDWFKYTWTWDKVNGVRNHLNAKRQPMRVKEDIAVFYREQCTYNPQMREGGYRSRKTKPGQSEGFGTVTGIDYGRQVQGLYPVDIICIESHDPNNSQHPTQKPIELMRYLIQTYSNEGDTVLDFTCGSGSTGVAALLENRNFIGIDNNAEYVAVAKQRIEAVTPTAE